MAEPERKTITLNIGVIGKSGCGKSTFINSFCRLRRGSDHAAKTDVIECTQEIMPYQAGERTISDLERWVCETYNADYDVVLWDCPGFGTDRHRSEEYLERLPVEKFDFYLLLSCTRVAELEIGIHNFIAQQHKAYFYVRTKFDRDIINDGLSHPKTSSVEKVKTAILNDVKRHFNKETPVFCVNCKDRDTHDFPKLEAELVSYASSSKYAGEKKSTRDSKSRTRKPVKSGKTL